MTSTQVKSSSGPMLVGTVVAALAIAGCPKDPPKSKDASDSKKEADARDGWRIDGGDAGADTHSDVRPSDTGADIHSDGDTQSPTDTTDASSDGDMMHSGKLEIQLGTPESSGKGFEPYGENEKPGFELVHGRQGGYHIEPTIFMTGFKKKKFDARISYEVFDRKTGKKVSRPTEYRISSYGWLEHDNGLVHYSPPVIFDISKPSDIVGTKVRLDVDLTIKGVGTATDSQKGKIVDDGR